MSSGRAVIARYSPFRGERLPDLFGGVVTSFSVGVEIFHRRRDALVTKLFLRVVWANVIRPVGRNPVSDRVPSNVLVVGDRKIALLNEAAQ